MEIVEIIFIAFGLAMDAFAVSVANGMTTTKHLRISNALKIAPFFGSFQTFMPVIGWAIGLSVIDFISGFDHWMAFGLLGFIGCKMIYEAVRRGTEEKKIMALNVYVLLMLAVATSIDALAVGVSFALLKIGSIAIPVIIIGIVTFLLSFLGASTGNKMGEIFGKKIEIAGGLILIGIGLKILIEHLV
jgi:putative Mn2+ efflux pump MntP